MQILKPCIIFLTALALSNTMHAAPLGSAFTYQGKLAQNGMDVTDNCDFEFGLWDSAGGGTEVGVAIDIPGVSVISGVFTVELDYGAVAFNGDARWLEIAVACPTGGGLATLAPRQELTPSPNAMFATEAGSVDWAGLSNVPPDIADGDDVDDADANPANELQDLDLSGNTLSLTGDASPVDLSGYLDNTDDQTLAEVLAQGDDAGGAPISNIGTTTTNSLTISSLDCTGNANGGSLTADASGLVFCSDDDSGAAGGNTLDQAYDQGGAGAGRTINADAGAVSIFGTDGLELDNANLLQKPANPVVVGSLAIGPAPTAIQVSGTYAYVIDMESDNLKVIDVTEPTMPSLVGSLGVGDFAIDIYVAGRYAYVVNPSGGHLRVVDVSDPTAPSLAGSRAFSFPTSVYVSGRFAYVVSAPKGELNVVDVADPTAPSLTGSLGIGGNPEIVSVAGRYAYVVDSDSNNFKVIDVSEPGLPHVEGSLGIGDGPNGGYVSGRYAYVTDQLANDLSVIDVSDPTAPSVVGSLGLGDTPVDVFVSGRYAYVSGFSSPGFKVIDVSDPTALAVVGNLDITASQVVVSGRYAYAADTSDATGALTVIDVSGAEVTSMMAHSLETGNLQVRNDVIAQGQLKVTGGVSVGAGGLFSDGNVGVAGDVSADTYYAGTSVAIGTMTPAEHLHVETSDGRILIGNPNCASPVFGAIGFGADVTCQNYSLLGEGASTYINAPAGGTLHFRIDDTTKARIDPDGFFQVHNLGAAGATSLCRNAQDQLATCSSSLRYKSEISDLTDGLDLLDRLRPVTFKWRGDGQSDIGLIAEEVAAVEPLLTTRNANGEIEGVKYDRMSALIINAIKEQQAIIEEQQEQINRLMATSCNAEP